MNFKIVMLNFHPFLEVPKDCSTFIGGEPKIELGAFVTH